MKLNRRRAILWIMALLAAFQIFAFLPRGEPPLAFISREEHSALFPSSLLWIEESAFEETAFCKLFFRDGLRGVGERAFSGMEQLDSAYIPPSTEYIADSAFARSGIKTIHGLDGSYAQRWAGLHYIRFEHADYWYTPTFDPLTAIVLLSSSLTIFSFWTESKKSKIVQYLRSFVVSMRPQDRPELHPVDYRFP